MEWEKLFQQLQVDSLNSFDLSNVAGGFSTEFIIARRNGDASGSDIRELIKVYSVIEYLTHRNSGLIFVLILIKNFYKFLKQNFYFLIKSWIKFSKSYFRKGQNFQNFRKVILEKLKFSRFFLFYNHNECKIRLRSNNFWKFQFLWVSFNEPIYWILNQIKGKIFFTRATLTILVVDFSSMSSPDCSKSSLEMKSAN